MENLFLIQAQSSHLPLLRQFSIPYEYTCVELCSYLKKDTQHLYIITDNETPSSVNNIHGFFHFHKALHLCLPLINEAPSKYSKLISEFFSSKNDHKINLIVGEKTSVEFVADILSHYSINSKYANEYMIMTLTKEPSQPPEALSEDDEIKCCTKQDINELINLQKQYLIKEVALPNQKITDNETTLMLSGILKNQVVMAVSSGLNDDEFVSKVNTNAIGQNWIQLGGIYTNPMNRRNYYAWHLIYTLCKRIQKNNKSICLFVKKRNNPAITLYKKIGFETKDDFKIIYF